MQPTPRLEQAFDPTPALRRPGPPGPLSALLASGRLGERLVRAARRAAAEHGSQAAGLMALAAAAREGNGRAGEAA